MKLQIVKGLKGFGFFVASLFFATTVMAQQVPASDQAKVPAQAQKGIATANAAQADHPSETPAPQANSDDLDGSPLSPATPENHKDSDVPSSDHAKIPAQAEKGITKANEAKDRVQSQSVSDASNQKDAEVPPSTHAELPPQSDKGIGIANDAKANHGKSGDHTSSTLSESAIAGPLSQESQDQSGKGVDKNKGKNAVVVLDRVATKLEARNSSHSKAVASVRRARQRILDRIS